MKKLFLYAYDWRNLGDDLFVEYIARRYPKAQLYIWSGAENEAVYGRIPNLKRIDPDSRVVRLLRKIRPSLVARYRSWLENRCDAVVYIGGSIFMEYPNWETICTWWEYEAKNRPFYVLGANFGPYHTEAYRKKMEEIFTDCRDVCFRDKYSASLFPGIVRQAPDILFGYPMPKVAVKPDQIFVSVINCAGRDESHNLNEHDGRYVANMAGLLQQLLTEGKKIVLASFCKEEGDEEGIRKILAAMGCEADPRVRVLCYDGTNADELTSAIAQSGGVIGTRFHATILAMTAGRPVLPIVYSDKTKHVLEDLGFTGTVYDLREDRPWMTTAMATMTVPACEAERHFAKLDMWLGR